MKQSPSKKSTTTDGFLSQKPGYLPTSGGGRINPENIRTRRRQPKTAQPSSEQAAKTPQRLAAGAIYTPPLINDQSTEDQEKKSKKDKRNKRPWSRKKKIWVSLAGFFGFLLLIGGFLFFQLNLNTSRVFQGNLFGAIFGHSDLKADQYGRTNLLIFGTSEDDPKHSGAKLADSIMVLSVNQETNDANTVSIPRDLWYQYDQTCSVGNQAKINTGYLCGLAANDNDEHKASLHFAKMISKVTGLDIQYYAKVNYAVVRDLVNNLGGIDVTIKSSDPRGIFDNQVSHGDDCPSGQSRCYLVNFPNGPAHLNGSQALALSRARNSHGGYGLSRSNFDRELNQQLVLKGIQKKALSSGTLANPKRALGILGSLGSNVRTNFDSNQIRTLIDVAKGIDGDNIITIDLNSKDNSLLTTDQVNGQSIVRPKAGMLDYSAIQQYIKSYIDPTSTAETN